MGTSSIINMTRVLILIEDDFYSLNSFRLTGFSSKPPENVGDDCEAFLPTGEMKELKLMRSNGIMRDRDWETS